MVAIGLPLPGSRNDCRAFTESGIDRACRGTPPLTDRAHLAVVEKREARPLPRGAVTPPRALDRPMAGSAVEFVGMSTPRLAHRMARAADPNVLSAGWTGALLVTAAALVNQRLAGSIQPRGSTGGVVLHADRVQRERTGSVVRLPV